MPNALFTDFYELTMLAGYHAHGMAEAPATFDLFFREPPGGVDLVVAAGLEPALEHLEGLAFADVEIDYLAGLGRFDEAFLSWLAELRFTGEVWAVPEGRVVFGRQPLLRVSAPLGQAQLVETALLNQVAYGSLIASNARQVVDAAGGKPILEFGARRAHGPDGALTASRAAMIGGCAATSNVEAAMRYGAPPSGTQAHSWIMAFEDELAAFRAYAEVFPDDCVLLLDTYDTLGSGLPNAVTVGRELAAEGHRLGGVRLDSGDLAALATEVRRGLDEAGLHGVRVLASGDLDAPSVAALEEAAAPIDGYGVGTALVTARQDPTLSGVYKLAQIEDTAVLKLSSSPEKATDPGVKQVWRTDDGDVVGLADEELDGEPLLEPAMRDGRRLRPAPDLAAMAERCAADAAWLAGRAGDWEVRRSDRLAALRAEVRARLEP